MLRQTVAWERRRLDGQREAPQIFKEAYKSFQKGTTDEWSAPPELILLPRRVAGQARQEQKKRLEE